MNSFFEWFSSGLKLKRWFLLLIVGVVLLSFGFSKFISSKELQINELIICIVSFILGFSAVIMSFFMSQRRILQAIAEANANPNGRDINLKKMLFDKKMLDKNIKVVAIGGGDGLASLLKGLKVFSNNITAIVNVTDNEKREGTEVSLLDIKKAVIALSNKEDDMEDFFTYTISSGEYMGRNLGNTFLELFNEMNDENLSKTIEKMSRIFAIRGSILPATLDNSTIGAILTDGTRVVGKKNIKDTIEENNVQIESMFLVPERCTPAPEVIRSIKEAEVIIIGPGSLYTSIIPTLLVKEISDAIRKSTATKIFVSNIMTEKNLTNDYSLSDHINAIHEHAGKGLFDYCIYSESDIIPEYIRRYNKDGADLIDIDKNNLKDMKITLVSDDLAVVDDKNVIRHAPLKLAQSIFKIVCENMNVDSSKGTLEYYTTKSKLKRVSKKNKKKNILFKDVKVIVPNKKH